MARTNIIAVDDDKAVLAFKASVGPLGPWMTEAVRITVKREPAS